MTSNIDLRDRSARTRITILYYAMIAQVMAERPASFPFSSQRILNFFISGLLWANVFYRSAGSGLAGGDLEGGPNTR